MRRLVVVAVLLVACGVPTVQAQSLSLAYRPGDTYKYGLHSTIKETIDASAMGMPVNVDLTAKEGVTVKSVDSSGTADLSVALSSLTIKSTAAGITNTTTGMSVPTIDVQVAADGRVMGINGNALGGGFSPLTDLSGIGGVFISAVLPAGAVKPGDTWAKDYDQANPDGTGGIHITTKSKYLRNESVGGVNAAVVETTSTGAIDLTIDMSRIAPTAPAEPGASQMPIAANVQSMTIKGTLTSDVTTWIDPKDHRILKSHATQSNDGTMTILMPASSDQPMLNGPVTIKGAATTDLSPA